MLASASHRYVSWRLQARDAEADQDRDEGGQGEDVDRSSRGAEALGEGADAGVHVVGGRPDRADEPAPPSSVETGWSSPENWMVGRMVRIAVTKTAATWLV